MFQFVRGFVLVATLLAICGVSLAEDIYSANVVMRGCRKAEKPPRTGDDAFQRGFCMGIVSTLGNVGLVAGVCQPANVTNFQMIRVVVKYIDERPERQHENFKPLALEAMQVAWPCRN
jgi:hypothetical protein